MSKHVVLTTFGSLGDLHPYLAIGRALAKRGYRVTLATSERYRDMVIAEQLGFYAVSPDVADFDSNPERIAYLLDERRGPERLTREVVMPHLRSAYLELLAVCADASVVVTHPLTYAARLVAEKLGIPWVSTALQPMVFFSRYDPPVLAPVPWLSSLGFLGPRFYGGLNAVIRWVARDWAEPWHRLRAEIGLESTTENPVFAGQFSPFGTLALFSAEMGLPQPDWPPGTVQTGFPFHDTTDLAAAGEILEFLEHGAPPIVFTRGSAAVYDARDFFSVSMEAAERLGQRALLTVGRDERNRLGPLPAGMLAVSYAPFSIVFPAASVVVHQCGIGTCGQALAAGKPMLLVPHAFDQPDNARRLERLGVGRTIGRGAYRVPLVTSRLAELLQQPLFRSRAEQAQASIRATDGAENACDALLRMAGLQN